jgi:hypothetical protein
MSLPRYYASEKDFQQFRATIKQQSCPHCRKTGTLNLHGRFCGYSDRSVNKQVLRGHRLFCNNRWRRPGCGRTVSVRPARFLPNFILTLRSLWLFLTLVAAGRTRMDAFCQAKTSLNPKSAYRIFRRVKQAQIRLRARLRRMVEPPESPCSAFPIAAIAAHLQAAFPNARCPPAEYQVSFQSSFPI